MSEQTTINFTRGVPAPESFPIEEMKIAADAALTKYGQVLMQYGKARGFVPLREWLAEQNGIKPENVLTANSSLQIIDFICHVMLEPGDVVFTEDPTYDRTVTLLRRHQAKIVSIPLEEDGPNIEALTAALEQQVPKFFYLIPDFQNPMGAVCSLEKRKQILELAHRYGFIIMEDAPYRPLRFRGEEIPAFFEMDKEVVFQIFAFTKLIGPGVRTSAIYGDAEVLERMATFANNTYICPTIFSQGVVYEFCASGQLEPQVAKIKKLYAPRLQSCLDSLATLLPDVDSTKPDGGFFLALNFPPEIDTAKVREQAKNYNLNLASGQAFFPNGGGSNFLRLPYCALTPEQINDGITRLAAAVNDVRG